MKLWNWTDGVMRSVRSRRRVPRRNHRGSRTIEVCEARILPAINVVNDTMTVSHGYFDSKDVGANDSAYGLHYDIYQQGTKGTAYIDQGGVLQYQSGGELGEDTVWYDVYDEESAQWIQGKVTITITNTAPTGVPDGLTAEFATTRIIDGWELIANDTDYDPVDAPEYNQMSVGAVGFPTNGTLHVNEQGLYEFTPTDGFVGNASFKYKSQDSKGALSEWTTVTVAVGASPMKYGNNTPGSGRPGVNVARDGAGTVTLNFFGYGPLNQRYAILIVGTHNGVDIYTPPLQEFTTGAGNGAWSKSPYFYICPVGTVFTYQILVDNGTVGNPNWSHVEGMDGSTTVQ